MEMGRPYADRMLSVIGHLANSNPEYKPLYMSEREVKGAGIIVVGSDKGLCGGLNINLFRTLLPFLKELSDQGIEQKFCPIGTKAKVFFNNFGGEVVSTAEKLFCSGYNFAAKIIKKHFCFSAYGAEFLFYSLVAQFF